MTAIVRLPVDACDLLRRLARVERRNLQTWRDAARIFQEAGLPPERFRPVVEAVVTEHEEDLADLEAVLGRLCGAVDGVPVAPPEPVPFVPRPARNGQR